MYLLNYSIVNNIVHLLILFLKELGECVADDILLYIWICNLPKKIRLDIACKSSAMQTMHK